MTEPQFECAWCGCTSVYAEVCSSCGEPRDRWTVAVHDAVSFAGLVLVGFLLGILYIVLESSVRAWH